MIPGQAAPVPLELDEALSPDWIGRAVSGLSGGARVGHVEIVQTERSLATKVRVAIEYDRDAPVDAPRHLCLKGFFDLDAYQASAARISLVETMFYLDVAPRVGLEVPDCLYARSDVGAGRGVILMRDIKAAGGTFMTALSPFGVDRAANGLDQLARLHVAHRNDAAAVMDDPLLVQRVADLALRPIIPASMLQELLDGRRGDTLPPEIRNAERLHRAIRALGEQIGSQPLCLVHGDPHAGNLYEIDGRIGLVDWQTFQKGSWAQDVAYHICAVLTRAEAEQSEWALLDHYLDCLRRHGGAAPGQAEARRSYRMATPYAYYLWGITRRVDPPIVEVFVDRLGSAVARHGAFELLGV